jgi:hypothetical protein
MIFYAKRNEYNSISFEEGTPFSSQKMGAH